MTRMEAVPITLREANDFVEQYHRHSRRTTRDGGRFAIGGAGEDGLFGVAIVGNPISATLMDGVTAEVTRLCVLPDARRGACSFLYARCWQAWRAMGGRKLVTYTLQAESGASLRGAGWRIMGEVKPHNRWSTSKAREWQPIYGQAKFRWEIAA